MREALGFDARELTPGVIRKITVLGAETRSFKRAAIALKEADVNVSAKTVERVMHDVGEELAERRDIPPGRDGILAQSPGNVPDLAVVECDGGRTRGVFVFASPVVWMPACQTAHSHRTNSPWLRCRQPDRGPGVPS